MASVARQTCQMVKDIWGHETDECDAHTGKRLPIVQPERAYPGETGSNSLMTPNPGKTTHE